ncbi:MAG TPA: hypothetical protein VKY74_28410, partial [Chloroflexia bacterium]|nr:hypothetical protein [Chloroflexia bacterium]
PVPGAVSSALSVSGPVGELRTWAEAVWTMLSNLVAQIDPWLAGAATLAVAGLGAAWWRIVGAFARRVGHREGLL